MPTHKNFRWTEIEDAMAGAQKLQDLAVQYGIKDIFVDNGGKTLQIVVALGLDVVPGRMGPDARDRIGNEYEIKSADISNGVKGFSTNHHLTNDTIARYAGRRFIFAIYDGIVLQEAYLTEPRDLAPIYAKWKRQLRTKTHLNNPKIPIDFVRDVGQTAYLKDVAPEWMPKAA